MPPSAPAPDRTAAAPAAVPVAVPATVAATPRLGRTVAALALQGALTLSLAAAAGCDRRPPPPLQPGDLRDDEARYVTRVLVLERVKARLVVDPAAGGALGDSLAAAWGDSALPRTLDLAPADPARAERVHALLLRLLASEQDSLLRRGGRRPLDAPWPTPVDSVSATPLPPSARVRADG